MIGEWDLEHCIHFWAWVRSCCFQESSVTEIGDSPIFGISWHVGLHCLNSASWMVPVCSSLEFAVFVLYLLCPQLQSTLIGKFSSQKWMKSINHLLHLGLFCAFSFQSFYWSFAARSVSLCRRSSGCGMEYTWRGQRSPRTATQYCELELTVTTMLAITFA